MSRYWYAYTAAAGDENVVGNYLLAPSKPNVICISGGARLCAIYSQGGTVPTTITQQILDYFVLASGRLHPYPDGIGQKPYVYVKV